MRELKRCPFCGGDNVGIWCNHPVSPLIEESYEAHCYDCHFGLHPVGEREEAIKAWNTRKPMDRIVERLEEQQKLYEKAREATGWIPDKANYSGFSKAFEKVITIVKEEGGV